MTQDSSASQLALRVQFDCPNLMTFADYADRPRLATTSLYFLHEQLYSAAHYATHFARRHKNFLLAAAGHYNSFCIRDDSLPSRWLVAGHGRLLGFSIYTSYFVCFEGFSNHAS
jgi:hypothetical protein